MPRLSGRVCIVQLSVLFFSKKIFGQESLALSPLTSSQVLLNQPLPKVECASLGEVIPIS